MRIIEQPAAMRRWSRDARAGGARVALVPTMGALHAGHLSLIDLARQHADQVVASVFVNPTQFDRADDFERYPRDLERDQRLLADGGVDILFSPRPADMYPAGAQTFVTVEDVSQPLCGAHRPGHFRGVATVVLKLFTIVEPDVGVFGEKDYQQVVLIRRMVRDLHVPVEIIGAPIVREADGLAMSSRNEHLAPTERRAAACLSRALAAAAEQVAGGERDAARIVAAARAVIDHEPLARVEYAACVDPESLAARATVEGRAVLALAVWFGSTRLIDNRLLVTSHEGRQRRSA